MDLNGSSNQVAVYSAATQQRDPARAWNDMFYALLAFKAKHGNCNVPAGYTENPPLRSWVVLQRKSYQQMVRGLPSTMTIQHAKLLESIGFVWEQNSEWNNRFRELQEYRLLNGDCNVPLAHAKFPLLGEWVQAQQDGYKQMMEGNETELTKEKIQLLNSISFPWKYGVVDSDVKQLLRKRKQAPSQNPSDHDDPKLDQQLSQAEPLTQYAMNGNNFNSNTKNTMLAQAQGQLNPQALYNFAQIKYLEDIMRRSMLQQATKTPQMPQQGLSFSPLLSQNANIVPPTTNFVVGDDGQLIYNDPKVASVAAQLAGAGQFNMPEHHYNVGNAGVSLPPLNISAAQACRLVTDDSNAMKMNSSVQATQNKSPDNTSQPDPTKPVTSTRYPGPQTSDLFWWARFDELKQFKKENGHCIVPNRYPPHPPLGNWVSTQRRQYKLWKKGKASSMNEDRSKALESIGFSWVVRSPYVNEDNKQVKESSVTISNNSNTNIIPLSDVPKLKEDKKSLGKKMKCFLRRKRDEAEDDCFVPSGSITSKKANESLKNGKSSSNVFVGGGVRETPLILRPYQFGTNIGATSEPDITRKSYSSCQEDSVISETANPAKKLKRYY